MEPDGIVKLLDSAMLCFDFQLLMNRTGDQVI